MSKTNGLAELPPQTIESDAAVRLGRVIQERSARVGVIAPRLCACAMAVFAIVVVSGLFGR